jgi:uncharacterized protein YndB with AHSA1/START domain
MTDRSVTHATFSLERIYAASTARVFAAWADPAAKSRWFAGTDADHTLDFQIGGKEISRGCNASGTVLTYTSRYQDIVPGERIVYSSTLSEGENLATVSLTTVEFTPADHGTRLRLVEQGAFLDGREDPSWRERGTGGWLDALADELRRAEERAPVDGIS